MKTIDRKSVMNRIINNETVSDIWVLDPNQIERQVRNIDISEHENK